MSVKSKKKAGITPDDLTPHVVMLVSNGFNPDPRPFKICCSLVKKGFNVSVYAWDREGSMPPKETIDGILVVRMGPRATYGRGVSQLFGMVIFWIYALFKLLKTPFSILHCHRFDTLPPSIVAGILKRRPVIYDLHIPFADRLSIHQNQMGMKSLVKLVSHVERLAIRFCFHCFTDSPLFTETIRSRGMPRVSEILNVPGSNFCASIERVSNNTSESFTIGRIGLMSRQAGSGVEDLIEIFERLLKNEAAIDPHLLLIGPCVPNYYRQEIEGRIAPYKDRVTLKGYIPYHEVPAWYRRMSISVIKYELHGKGRFYRLGTQQKVFESMACGVPIVIFSNKYMNKLVEDIGCGIVSPTGDAKDLYDAVLRIAINPNIRSQMSAAGRRAHLQYYNWEKEEKHLYYIYNLALNNLSNKVRL